MSASTRMTESGSSSESDNEEETKRLREASFVGFIGEASSSSNAPGHKNGRADGRMSTTSKSKQSLRPSAETEEDKMNSDLQTTPEVRAFIAKKLSQALDQSIELLDGKEVKERYNRSDIPVSENEGFKLFSSKTQQQLDIKLDAKRRRLEELQLKRKKKESSSDSSDEEARLAEAAVSAEFVLQHSGIHSTHSAVTVDTISTEEVKNGTSETEKRSPHTDSDSISLVVSPDSGISEQNNHKHNHNKKKQNRKRKELTKSIDCDDERINTEISAKKKKKKCKHRHSEATNT